MKHKSKVEKLDALKREVQDFHPVLNELFKKMPQFERVEYTQGIHEFGADFVLESYDDFGDLRYTGVVVKVGSITQNATEVYRQIEECFDIERNFDNGSKKIKITSVTVVTNSSISKNAEEVISQKYKGRLIRFFDKEKLISLIDKYYSEYWEDSRVFLNEYLIEQTNKANRICIGNILDFDSNANYVDIQIKKKNNNNFDKISSFRNVSSLNQAIDISNIILLEGNMGTGKSVMVAKHVLKVIENFKSNNNSLIPLLLEFSDFKDNIINEIKDTILAKLNQIKKDVDNPKLIVYLDGLDEINLLLEDRKIFIEELYKIMSEFPNFIFIVTTRIIEDYEFDIFLDNFFEKYIISPLKHNQIISIINSFYTPDEKIGSQLAESNLFRMLPKTPITAILLGQILKSDPKEIPSTLTELYSKFMEIVLSRWDSNNLKSQTEYEALLSICGRFAYFMLANSLSTISINELNDMIDSYLKERNIALTTNQISEKIIKNNEIFSINTDKNTIKFRHKSFCEFFYAHHVHRNNTAIIDENIYNPYWSNSYFFFFGLVKDSSKLLQSLNNIQFSNYGLKLLQVIINSELLLAAYLTPYQDIENQVNNSLNIASETVLEMILDMPQINHMQQVNITNFDLIMMMIVIISKSYNYEFYSKAMKNIADKILLSNQDYSDKKWLKLFFISATLAEQKDFYYINKVIEMHNSKKVKISDANLNILFNIICTYKVTNSSSINSFLKVYKRNFKKGSKTAKLIQSLLKTNQNEEVGTNDTAL